jgi:outer membrane protein OmpA-like peptidoglycan-associated protein
MNAFKYFLANRQHGLAKVKRSSVQFVRLLIACAFALNAYSQNEDALTLADQYYAAGEYYTAAILYGQHLHPVKKQTTSDFPLNSKKKQSSAKNNYASDLDIRFKQAESYRLANYWAEAAALYDSCYKENPNACPQALYWYAVCERSLGNYAVARQSIDHFIEKFPDSYFQTAAAEEKERLQFISQQVSRPDTVLYSVEKLSTDGTTTGVYAPANTNNNQLLFTSTVKDSVAQGVNPFFNRLFQSEMVNGEVVMTPLFETDEPLIHQGAASVSADGNTIYLTQWKKENGQSASSIYYITRKENGWSQPTLLSSLKQEGSNNKQPFCTADGKYLYFASDRPGGSGAFDIWYAPFLANGTTGEPVNAGTPVNTAGNEQAPFYHTADNTLVFSSDRMPGMGGYDLFTSRGTATHWNMPENMGHPVNSSRDDIYYFASEKQDLLTNALISSDRGNECCLNTYAISKTPKKKVVAGVIKDCKDNAALAGTEVTMKLPSGKTVTTITAADGSYAFELTGDINERIFVASKEKYNEKTADINVDGGKSGWLIDTIYNAPVCLEKKLVIKVENVVTVYFDFDQSSLRDRATQQLDSIYNVLVENPTATIQVSGYTDGLGSVAYNKILSDKRAKACADYLISKGIDPARISFESFGACCPVEMEMINGRDNPDGRSMNRRALININKE